MTWDWEKYSKRSFKAFLFGLKHYRPVTAGQLIRLPHGHQPSQNTEHTLLGQCLQLCRQGRALSTDARGRQPATAGFWGRGAARPLSAPPESPPTRQGLQTHPGLLRGTSSDLLSLIGCPVLKGWGKEFLHCLRQQHGLCCKSWFTGKEISFGNIARRAIKLNYRVNTSRWTPVNLYLQLIMQTFSSVQSLSPVWLFVTPRIAAGQALCPTPGVHSNSCPSSRWRHPAISSCRPLLLLPPIPPSIRLFSNEPTLRMRWPKYWSLSFLPKNTQDWSPLEWTGWISLQSKGLSRVFSITVQKHQFFGAQL